MRNHPLTTLIVFLTFIFAPSAWSTEFTFDEDASLQQKNDPIRFELTSEATAVQPGKPFWVALHADIDDHWHSYWKHPGDAGMPSEVEWTLPEGYEISALEWPFPRRFEQDGFVGFGFEKTLTLLAKITPPVSAPLDATVPLKANIRWLICSDESCLPGESTVSTTLSTTSGPPVLDPTKTDFFAQARALLPQPMWNTEVTIRNGLIDLQIEAPESTLLGGAYFCPSEEGVVDIKTNAILTPSADQPARYSLLLKPYTKEIPKVLTGVLVFETNGRFDAFEVHLPIFDQPSPLSLADEDMPSEGLGLKDPTAALPTDSLAFDGGVGLALVLAFIGGILLNLMPCVLPVVSFKILSFVKMAGQSRSLIFKHGLMFSAGVLVSFWALAGLMLALQAYGQAVGWGFQLQEPIFVAGLAAFLFLFALSLFGVFELGVSATSWAGNLNGSQQSSALIGSFFSGVLATTVATPCTGPFLGSAVGFAVTLPVFWALLIFTSLGFGMAFPYLLLAGFPSLLRFIPKPGNWMNVFKEVLGFFMLATVLWLVWVFSAQTSTLSVSILLTTFFILAVGAWIYGRWGTVVNSKRSRMASVILAASCLCLAGYTISLATSPTLLALETTTDQSSTSEWETFSPERVAELQAAGVPVFVDFTAKWCLICQANHFVLSTDHVEEKMKEKGVVKMKADWTKRDPVITNALKQLGRNSVPLYVLYGTDTSAQPVILPQVLTPDLVIEEVDKLNAPIASK